MTEQQQVKEQPLGRRERKKAATRRALSEAALRLFLERGYDDVKVAEIAAAADTALTTLFAHFPGGKEALILGDSEERRSSLTAAVRGRADGTSVLDALHTFLAGRGMFADDLDNEFRRRLDLVVRTPALRRYARTLWVDCEHTLAQVIAEETGKDADDLGLRLLARYVLEVPDLVATDPAPRDSLAEAFEHFRRGWPDLA
ncbi:TetR/AcrR family transcriptional regulator [Streptomyces sp. VRA16 Mangrove soil]|uniref:TetR/AcrR family transcriptional regulator n=1 Tax=Streptomyces sp. VRA16 Mangrove soil TaxID=2817434 RepID=UPI001A9D028D|nr:TetR family transcriptional regulator [Streptomyces sp. VRA16 Mangrove soil]MBO1337834.1 TetR family transcriptional regulator [Streptomyces sp. VRA16 Mangrove soil]